MGTHHVDSKPHGATSISEVSAASNVVNGVDQLKIEDKNKVCCCRRRWISGLGDVNLRVVPWWLFLAYDSARVRERDVDDDRAKHANRVRAGARYRALCGRATKGTYSRCGARIALIANSAKCGVFSLTLRCAPRVQQHDGAALEGPEHLALRMRAQKRSAHEQMFNGRVDCTRVCYHFTIQTVANRNSSGK